MEKVKVTFFGNFILYATLIFAYILNIFVAFICKYFVEGEKGILVFYTVLFLAVLQIPMMVFLCKSISKRRDYVITRHEILQDNQLIVTKENIVSIKRKNIIQTEIKYKIDDIEYSLFTTIGKRKLNYIKYLLSIKD